MKTIIKSIVGLAFIFGIYAVVKYYNKEEKKLYRYIGTSIIDTPNTAPENCTIAQREYYESLIEIK